MSMCACFGPSYISVRWAYIMSMSRPSHNYCEVRAYCFFRRRRHVEWYRTLRSSVYNCCGVELTSPCFISENRCFVSPRYNSGPKTSGNSQALLHTLAEKIQAYRLKLKDIRKNIMKYNDIDWCVFHFSRENGIRQ